MKRYTFRDWRASHEGQVPLWVRPSYRDVWSIWSPKAWQVLGWLPELWYYLRCRFWTRYNRFDVLTLPPTWQDTDEKLLHVCFHLLTDYVEKERPFEHTMIEHALTCTARGETDAMGQCVSCGVMPSSAEFGKEVRELYRWWTVERQQEIDAYQAALDAWSECRGTMSDSPSDEAQRLFDEVNAVERRNEDREDEMLTRLLKIRRSMWT